MTRKILYKLLLFFFLAFSVSCSKDKSFKNLSSKEITNYLLVNEQLPIKTLSNALDFPENIIIAINLGLIEINEEGEQKLRDIFQKFMDEGKNDFIKKYNKKKQSEFIKNDWVKKEIKSISKSKLNEIKEQDFKNNEIISSKIEGLKKSFVKDKTDDFLDNELSLLSKNYYVNMYKIFSIHILSVPQKIKNLSVSYLNQDGVDSFNNEWDNILSSYINDNELNKINQNYFNFIEFQKLKYKFLTGKNINLDIHPVETKLLYRKTDDDAIVTYFSSDLLDYLIDFLILPTVILFIPVIVIIYSLFFNISNFFSNVAGAINFSKVASPVSSILFVFFSCTFHTKLPMT
ncbi:hypothetical protein [Flavobacterium sp. UBA4854]|uniref:hypothetical protein n=1 Tax=Flavobacterium sp. UBA4854 TaxID=1946548 RepID=UPI002579C623|nr:hypothetical protein [Flavobacterium sp. UBA4854]